MIEVTDWDSAEGARKGHDLQREQAEHVRETRDRHPREGSAETLSIEGADGETYAITRLVVDGYGMDSLDTAEYRLKIHEGGTYRNVLTGNEVRVKSIASDGTVEVTYLTDCRIRDQDAPAKPHELGLIESADEETPDPIEERGPAPWEADDE